MKDPYPDLSSLIIVVSKKGREEKKKDKAVAAAPYMTKRKMKEIGVSGIISRCLSP